MGSQDINDSLGLMDDDNLADQLTMALLDDAGESLGTEPVRLNHCLHRNDPSSLDDSNYQAFYNSSDDEKSDTEHKNRLLVGEDDDEDSEFFRKKSSKGSPNKKIPNTRSKSKQVSGKSGKQPRKRVIDSDGSGAESSTSNTFKPKVKNRKLVVSSDDESEHEYGSQNPSTSKFNIQYTQVKKSKTTVDLEREERERIKRVAEKQAKYNNIVLDDGTESLDQALNDSFNSKTPKVKSLILDDCDGKKVNVHSSIVRHLKPHQLTGVQFLYDCTIESIDRLAQPGGGGILAHCMGLGKTLQTIAFLHTVMTDPVVSKTIRRVMVVCPKNVVLNWQREFQKWLFENDSLMPDINVFELDSVKTYDVRADVLDSWFNARMPGVMIIGYEMYRLLVQDYNKPNKKGKIPAKTKNKKLLNLQEKFRQYLQDPGPDIIVCDEGHKLKNCEAEVTIAINKVRTKRRICLTGTPLQNNLDEYYTMVNFIKPGLLGRPGEFEERFKKPIEAGQTKDADEIDVAQMRRRCHVLFTKLKGVIDRRDFTVLQDSLLPKLEYVISLRLTEKQAKLYQLYLDTEVDFSNGLMIMQHYYTFARIFSHPYQLFVHQEEKALKDEKKVDEFIVEDSGSDEESNQNGLERPQTPEGWFETSGILEEKDRFDFSLSYKLIVLVHILKECESIGDKVLIFSQSLETLRLIRRMLESLEKDWFKDGHEAVLKPADEKWRWQLNKDYMLITGSVSSKDRDIIQQQFNSQDSARIRLCLISTKAGSLGTNFVAANRVIIMDQNWNPSHDRQAMFRAYRFGQTKPVYVYRLVAFGTIEDRIYARQVTKESIATRVLDENQVKRHYTYADLAELLRLEISEYDESKPPLYAPPEDELLACVFSRLKEAVVNCIQHDSLLAHVEDENLTAEERKEAWDEFNKNINDRKQARKNVLLQQLADEHSQSTDSLPDANTADLADSVHTAAPANALFPNIGPIESFKPEALELLAKIFGINGNNGR
ncbi:SNF2-related and DNA RNA helicase domain containing protein [Aphelenchoides bicaudatus]|nr:SNF2-related and DNA RNA helicase domain containing protein [Aphelenchoides bicaudatus]